MSCVCVFRLLLSRIAYGSEGVLSYEDKYFRDGGKKTSKSAAEGMANLARVIDPPMLAAALRRSKAYSILGCSGTARFGFIMDPDKNEIYFQ
jgi:D-alanine-D-alanine ligase-like ATP-grasp enzyme